MKYNNIYLDSHATTRVDQDVLAAMLPYFTEHYGNGNHKAGWKTDLALKEARYQVSSLIASRPSEIVFTSGATESINLALLGLAQAANNGRTHIVTQATEHKAVLESVAQLKRRGFTITILGVDSVGRIDLDELRSAVSEKTLVVAVMLANNEIGTVQPIEEIGRICRTNGAKLFCDLTQGVGWHPIDVDRMHIDLASFSSHKIYGPRGVGALYMRRRHPKVKIDPIVFGGGQEGGVRPGTVNIPGIVGFGKACEFAQNQSADNFNHIRTLRDRLKDYIFNSIQGVKLSGCEINGHPGNLNIAIPGVTGEELIGGLPNIMFSVGSACTSGSAKPSHVILALQPDAHVLTSSFRFGIGKYNTIDEIDYVGEKIVEAAGDLQKKRGIASRAHQDQEFARNHTLHA